MPDTDVSTSPFRTRINHERLSEQLRTGTFYIDPRTRVDRDPDEPLKVRPFPIIYHAGDPDPDHHDPVPVDPVKPLRPVDPINPDRINPDDYDNPLITGPDHPDYDPFRDPLIHSRPNYDLDQYRPDINDIPDINPLSCICSNLTKNLRIVGTGNPSESCYDRVPVVVDDKDKVLIHTLHRCNNRSCPVCVDDGFVKTTASRETDDMVRWMISKLRTGDHYDIVPDTDRPYLQNKAYHVIVSMGPDVSYETYDDMKRDRTFVIKVLKKLGMCRGNVYFHPYRGPVSSGGPDRRNTLDYDHPSGHFHVIGICRYFRSLSWLMERTRDRINVMVERSRNHYNKLGPGYDKLVRELGIMERMIVKVPDNDDPDVVHDVNGRTISGILGTFKVPRDYDPYKTYPDGIDGPTDQLRGRINKVISYELDHAGYWDGTQISVRFGERVDHDPDDDRQDPIKKLYLMDNERGIINEYLYGSYRDPDGTDHQMTMIPDVTRERIDRDLKHDGPFGEMQLHPMNGNVSSSGYHSYRDIDECIEPLLYDDGGIEWDHRICRLIILSRERIKRLIRGDV